MCLDNILPPQKRKDILAKYPPGKLIKGWKTFRVTKSYVTGIYRSFIFHKEWNHANTDDKIKALYSSKKYKSGFHVCTTKKGADHYALGRSVITIPVYYLKTDVIAIGLEIRHQVTVVKKILIHPEDIKKARNEAAAKELEKNMTT